MYTFDKIRCMRVLLVQCPSAYEVVDVSIHCATSNIKNLEAKNCASFASLTFFEESITKRYCATLLLLLCSPTSGNEKYPTHCHKNHHQRLSIHCSQRRLRKQHNDEWYTSEQQSNQVDGRSYASDEPK